MYSYDPTRGNRVVEHVESWEVSGLEAVAQMFRPGKGRAAETSKRDEQASSKKGSALSKAGPRFRMFASAMMPVGMGLLSTGMTEQVLSRVGRGGDMMVAHAVEEKREIANIPASGLIFKDTINVEALIDKKVSEEKTDCFKMIKITPVNPSYIPTHRSQV